MRLQLATFFSFLTRHQLQAHSRYSMTQTHLVRLSSCQWQPPYSMLLLPYEAFLPILLTLLAIFPSLQALRLKLLSFPCRLPVNFTRRLIRTIAIRFISSTFFIFSFDLVIISSSVSASLLISLFPGQLPSLSFFSIWSSPNLTVQLTSPSPLFLYTPSPTP